MLAYLLNPSFQCVDVNGKPLTGGYIQSFLTGTTSQAVTYSDFSGTQNASRVTLDAKGMAKIIADSSAALDVYCYNASGVLQWSRSSVTPGAGGISAIPQEAVTYYLDSFNGKDTNTGKSRYTPKKTGDACAIAAQAEGVSTGRLVVMPGSMGVTLNSANWTSAVSPFFDIVCESFYSDVTFNAVSFPAGDYKIAGGVLIFNGGSFSASQKITGYFITFNGTQFAGNTTLCAHEELNFSGMVNISGVFHILSENRIRINGHLGLAGVGKISCVCLFGNESNSIGTPWNDQANNWLNLDLECEYLEFEGFFNFPDQSETTKLRLKINHNSRVSTSPLLLLGAKSGVTVSAIVDIDSLNSAPLYAIANPSGTVSAKAVQLLQYENKVDAEILRATAAEALKADLVNGVVPSSQLPSSLALGETSSTAYRGDRGKAAYDHSLMTSGNPHNVTKFDVGLGNVDNVSDADKPVSTATAAAIAAHANLTTGMHGLPALDHFVYGDTAYGGTIADNLNTLSRTMPFTCYGTAVGAPDTTHSWFGWHINSNTGTTAASQMAIAFGTDLIVKYRTKSASVWGPWKNGSTIVNDSTSTAYTFLASDANTCHIVNTAAATTRTVPSDTTAPDIAIGDFIEVQNIGTGVVTFVADSGVTIRSSLTLVMYGQYSVCMLRKIAANTWVLTGERTAV